MTIRIGISGWQYADWRGRFYPEGLAQKRELEYASRALASIEINGTFYSLQRPESFTRWREETPEGFVFSVKGPRFITHVRRLVDVEAPLANFFASGLFNLRAKLGPILWQFPPNFSFDAARLAAFFAQLPADTDAAQALARRHDYRMEGRAALYAASGLAIRHAIEVRSASFLVPAFIDLVRRHRLAVVIADSPGLWPYFEDLTADFVYMRMHGKEARYAGGYTDAALDRLAERVSTWHRGDEPADARRVGGPAPAAAMRDVYVYFDNDEKAHAPADAMRLSAKLRVAPASATAAPRRRRKTVNPSR